jgi:hypothetical protein
VVDAQHVRETARWCTEFLTDQLDADWSAAVPDLDLTISGVVAHAAEGCLWYAIDLAAGGEDLDPIEHRVKLDSAPQALIATLKTYAHVLAAVIDTSPATARGFHPMGLADPSGFAAMACDEMLIHTDDAARGLGAMFDPSPDLAEPVLQRLFPWVEPVTEPWAQLRWASGRIELDGRPRLEGWAWHCAPLDEWNGEPPAQA